MTISSIKSSTLQESVFEELFQAIVTGYLLPGERVTIRSLAEKMDVSVMPVREALRRLEAMGCITSENRKFTVNELSVENLNEIYELRIMLECRTAVKACHTRTEADLERLEKIHEKFMLAVDGDPFLELNKNFHFGIYQATQNPITMHIISYLWDRVSPYLYILSKNIENMMSENIIVNHIGMITALRERDGEAIRKWIAKDLTDSAELIVRVIQEGKYTATK